jgi:hypothetical protein
LTVTKPVPETHQLHASALCRFTPARVRSEFKRGSAQIEETRCTAELSCYPYLG